MKLKILLVLIIGLFTISPTFADYWPLPWEISIYNYWIPMQPWWQLDLQSTTDEIYTYDIYIIKDWLDPQILDSNYCEAGFTQYESNWLYHLTCSKSDNFFSENDIWLLYIYIEPIPTALDTINTIGSWALASAWWISSWATGSFLFIWLWAMFLLAIAGLIILFIRQIKSS